MRFTRPDHSVTIDGKFGGGTGVDSSYGSGSQLLAFRPSLHARGILGITRSQRSLSLRIDRRAPVYGPTAPDPPHGSIDARLVKSLMRFLLDVNDAGEVHHPREPIYKDDDTYLEPDMMYVSDGLKNRMGRKRTSADIVFEYVSKSGATYDRTTKAHTYLMLGVRELWLVDSATVTIEVRHAAEHKGKPVWESRLYSLEEVAESRVLSGWRVPVDELFAGLI